MACFSGRRSPHRCLQGISQLNTRAGRQIAAFVDLAQEVFVIEITPTARRCGKRLKLSRAWSPLACAPLCGGRRPDLRALALPVFNHDRLPAMDDALEEALKIIGEFINCYMDHFTSHRSHLLLGGVSIITGLSGYHSAGVCQVSDGTKCGADRAPRGSGLPRAPASRRAAARR